MAEFASEMRDVPDQKQPVEFEGFSTLVFTETVKQESVQFQFSSIDVLYLYKQ